MLADFVMDRRKTQAKPYEKAERAPEASVSREVSKCAHDEAWIKENQSAIDSWNEYVAKNGLPLARYRTF